MSAAVAFQAACLRWGLLTGTVVAVLDQVTKWWILTEVMQPPRVIPLTPFFNLTLGRNRGVSFGLLSSEHPAAPLVLALLAIAIILGLVVWIARARSRLQAIALGAIMGGAVGNTTDRLHHSAVTDFLDLHAWGWHWPAFNLADTAITLGVVALLAGELLGERQHWRRCKPSPT